MAGIRQMEADEKIDGLRYLYVEGDYSASYQLAEKYKGTKYGGYGFFTNNCLHYVKELLQVGQAKNDMIQKTIENCNAIIPVVYVSYITALSLYIGSVANSVNQQLK